MSQYPYGKIVVAILIAAFVIIAGSSLTDDNTSFSQSDELEEYFSASTTTTDDSTQESKSHFLSDRITYASSETSDSSSTSSPEVKGVFDEHEGSEALFLYHTKNDHLLTKGLAQLTSVVQQILLEKEKDNSQISRTYLDDRFAKIREIMLKNDENILDAADYDHPDEITLDQLTVNEGGKFSGTTEINKFSIGGDTFQDLSGAGLSVVSGSLVVDGSDSLSTSLATGSVAFSDGSTLSEDNSGFFWDDANDRLGVGTSSPDRRLTVAGGDINLSDRQSAYQIDGQDFAYTSSTIGSTMVGIDVGTNNTDNWFSGFGEAAGQSNDGTGFAGFGYKVGQSNTSDWFSGFGRLAGQNNTGIAFSGFGVQAGQDNSGGTFSGVGDTVGRYNEGDYFSGLGGAAGMNNTGDYNTFVGYQAGYANPNLAGGNNTFLGANASYDGSSGTSTITNSTAVGANVTLTDPNTVILGDGANVGIGTTTPSERLELGKDDRIKLSTDLSHLDDSSLLRMQWTASTGKPAIGWFNEEGDRQAAMVAHEGSSLNDNTHEHFSIETSNTLGELHTRFSIDFGKDQSEVKVSSADFNIGAGNDFILGTSAGADSTAEIYGDIFGYGTKAVGFGDKDWAAEGLETGAKWEFYRDTTDAEMLVHTADATDEANLHLRVGTRDWKVMNNGSDLMFNSEGETKMSILEANGGWVGIGNSNPQSTLDVSGTTTAQAFSLGAGNDTINDFSGSGLSVASNILSVDDVETLSTSLTSGSIAFSNGSTLTQDNSNFFWDDTNDRLGIGTANPVARLDFGPDSTDGLSPVLGLGASSSGVRQLQLEFDQASWGQQQLAWREYDSSGNVQHELLSFDAGDVGIGTTNPSSKLQVAGGMDVSLESDTKIDSQIKASFSNSPSSGSEGGDILIEAGYMDDRAGSTNSAFDLQGGDLTLRAGYVFSERNNDGAGSRTYKSGDVKIYSGDLEAEPDQNLITGDIHLGKYGRDDVETNYMTVKGSTGNVGIGTTNPSKKLSVLGEGYITKGGTEGSEGILELRGGHTAADASSDPISSIYFGSTEGGGDRSASIRALAASDFNAGDTPTHLAFYTTQDNQDTPTEKLRISGNGYANFSGTISQGNVTNCTLAANSNGDILCESTASDARLKTNVSDLEASSTLASVNKLEAKRFRFKEESSHFGDGEQIGFMAQDVEKIFPEFVGEHSDGIMYVDYAEMTSVLAEAIQAVDAKVEDVKRTDNYWVDDVNNDDDEDRELTDSFIAAVSKALENYVGDVAANLKEVFASNIVAENTLEAGEEICIDGECLSKSQLKALISVVENQDSDQFADQDDGPEVMDPKEEGGDTGVEEDGQETDQDSDKNSSATSTSDEGGADDEAGQEDDGTDAATSTEDTVPPTISLLGDNPATITVGDAYTDSGAEATDDVDGDVTDQIEFDDSNLEVGQAGEYELYYEVADSAGNAASTTRTVIVEPQDTDAATTTATTTATSSDSS